MLIDIRKLIRVIPIKRGKAFLIRILAAVLPAYRYEIIELFGHTIKLDFKDNAAIELYLNYGLVKFETEIFHFLDSIIQHDDIFWDVGANIGYYTLFLAGKCNVLSFEPNPYLFLRLNDAVRNHSNATIYNYALFNENKTLDFYLNRNSSNLSGLFSLHGLPIKVSGKTADGLILSENLKAPTVMKIDVEGYEYFVLKGFQLLNKFKPIVIFEHINDFGKRVNITLTDIIKCFGEDWKFYRFNVNRVFSEIDDNSVNSTNNYLAINKNDYRIKFVECARKIFLNSL